MFAELEALFRENKQKEAGICMNRWLARARSNNDWKSELTVLNEQIGFYRKTGEKERGVQTIQRAFFLVEKYQLGKYEQGAVTWMNGATAYRAFGEYEKSCAYFQKALEFYREQPETSDYKLASLYNNMALLLTDLNRGEQAETCFKEALRLLRFLPGKEAETANTYVSMAHMYDRMDLAPEKKKEKRMHMLQAAWKLLTKHPVSDSYTAAVCSTCSRSFFSFGMKREGERLKEMAEAYYRLEAKAAGYPKRKVMQPGRTGALETGAFYYGLIGCRAVPETSTAWFYAPETAYACAAGGRLFYCTGSRFEQIRERLRQYYPEDVRRKKIAARAVSMAQAGQYNYVRCKKRGEDVAAVLALSEFIKASCSMIHLLNKQYMPFYKWAFKSTLKQPVLGQTAQKMQAMAAHPLDQKNEGIIEEICVRVKAELQRQDLSGLDCDFLEPHGQEIMSRIQDEKIRSLPVLFG